MSGKFGRDEGEIPDEKEVIRRQIDALRAHIYSHIIWYKSNYLSILFVSKFLTSKIIFKLKV